MRQAQKTMAAPKRTTKAQSEEGIARFLATLDAHTKLLAFFFGLCFVAAALVLAIWFPQPTAFQYTVFRIVLALAAAGIAGVIPGMIRLKVQPGAALLIHAGGALAVFVMVYLLAPARLQPEEHAPPSPPPPKEKPAESKAALLKISNVDAIENGVHVLNFTPPGAVHIVRISNIGDVTAYISLIGFPEQYFYTNLTHEDLTIKGHADKEIRVVLTCNFPAQEEYVFKINDSAGGTAQMAIRLNKGWDQYLAQRIQYIRYKNGQGASTAELHQEAKQLIAAAEAKDLTAPLQEAMAGQLLAAADQPEAAALAYSKSEKEEPRLAERFIVNSPPEVMTALADIYERESNVDREQHWRNFAEKIPSVSKSQNLFAKRKETGTYQLKADSKLPAYYSNKKKSAWQYTDNGDGTITDTATGLMWKRCSEGLSGINCEEGEIERYTWDAATQRFKNAVVYAGYADWRLPTLDELKTLVQCSNGRDNDDNRWCNDIFHGHIFHGPTINQQAFPNTEDWSYWSGSPSADSSDSAWSVNFFNGSSNDTYRGPSYSASGQRYDGSAVRLVRGQ